METTRWKEEHRIVSTNARALLLILGKMKVSRLVQKSYFEKKKLNIAYVEKHCMSLEKEKMKRKTRCSLNSFTVLQFYCS